MLMLLLLLLQDPRVRSRRGLNSPVPIQRKARSLHRGFETMPPIHVQRPPGYRQALQRVCVYFAPKSRFFPRFRISRNTCVQRIAHWTSDNLTVGYRMMFSTAVGWQVRQVCGLYSISINQPHMSFMKVDHFYL
jgi:hypothetical protein